MRVLAEARERLRAALKRSSVEAETEAEMRFHLEMETEANIRAGMAPEEARRRAHVTFGALERYRAEVRDARGLGCLEVLARDARYAWRGLRTNRSFAAALIATLALGIGASIAMFSILDALLLRPLPYAHPEGLVEVFTGTPERAQPYVGWEDARRWREQPGLFSAAFSHVRQTMLYTGGGEPRSVLIEGVTPEMEAVLGVHPALGRGLLPEDAERGAAPVIVLDHRFWRYTLGGDPAAVGREIELDGARRRVVGVMPRGFKFPEYATTEGWIPIPADHLIGGIQNGPYLVGRLADRRIEVAQARADAAGRAIAAEQPRESGWSIQMRPLGSSRGNGIRVRASVTLLAGAVGLLLLISSVNVTSLLLVRGWARFRELAVRVALGATRARIAGQLVTESIVVTLISAAAAALLAWAALRAVRGILPGSITFFAPFDITLSWRALAFTFGVATLVAAVIGVVPALRLTGPGTLAARGSLTPYAAQSPGANRLRRLVVAGEIGLSVMLLVGAGLLLRSFARLMSADPGFRVENLAVMKLTVSDAAYPDAASRNAFLRSLEERIEALPGVEGVALNGNVPPNAGLYIGPKLEAQGTGVLPSDQPMVLPFANVPPDFFPVLGVRVRAGRAFDAHDAGTDHAIVDAGLARYLWGNLNPLGRRFRADPQLPWQTVIGVVGDLRMMGPDDREGSFEILYPLEPDGVSAYTAIAIRTRGDPTPLLPAIRRAVHEVDPRQPIEKLAAARELYGETVDMPRFLAILMGTLSGLALLLASVGIYGVLSFTVVKRRREIAIRTALGAPVGAALRRVFGESVALAAAGVSVGIVAALGASRLIAGVLYDVRPADPTAIGVVAAVTLTAALLAAFMPARRAARIDPIEVLRAD